MKKLLAFLLALLMLVGGAAFAEETGLTRDIVVLFTSDVHCGVDQGFGYAGLAAVRDTLKRTNHVLLVDNGDAIQGETHRHHDHRRGHHRPDERHRLRRGHPRQP